MASTSTSIPSPSPRKKRPTVADLRLPAVVVATVSTAVLSLLLAGPSFKSVLSFFRPLLLSTAVFLVAVAVLRLVSPPVADPDGGKAGSGLIEYVAGPSLDDDGEARPRSSSSSLLSVGGGGGADWEGDALAEHQTAMQRDDY